MMNLYIYDHCPYCVKARMIFGIKNQKKHLVTLANDDEKTPSKMIGKKMVPILEKAPKEYMPESLDIIRYVDELSPPTQVKWEEDPSLLQIFGNCHMSYRSLVMPRWVNTEMEEFQTPEARKYFQNRVEKLLGQSFDEAHKNTSSFKEEIENHLVKISELFPAKNHWYKGTDLSLNDFHLFAFLRALSIVKGLCFPSSLRSYMERCEKECKIPLHFSMAS